MIQRTFFGQPRDTRTAPDLSNVAFGTVLFIAVLQIWLGLYPKIVLITARPVMEQLVQPAMALSNPTHSPSGSLLSSRIPNWQGTTP